MRKQEIELEIYLNLSETISLFEILCTYIKEESEHYWENDFEGENHMVYHFINLINGLPLHFKKEILRRNDSGLKEIKLPKNWNENLTNGITHF
uniref:hypothetical protein n=1 Tax=Algoriphagus sp. TaxID=1872435 RepID=UPI0040471F7C